MSICESRSRICLQGEAFRCRLGVRWTLNGSFQDHQLQAGALDGTDTWLTYTYE
jgi:hypothetical protein